MCVFGGFKSTSLILNGNISDVLLKYDIIYQYVGCLFVKSVSMKKTSDIWNSQWMVWHKKNPLTQDLRIKNN